MNKSVFVESTKIYPLKLKHTFSELLVRDDPLKLINDQLNSNRKIAPV